MAEVMRTIRCQRCPVLVAANPGQYVGLCPACRAAGERLRVAASTARKQRKKQRRVRDLSQEDPAADPFFVACCDCPRLFGYWGGVPNPRCPVCDAKHRAEQAAAPKRAKRKHDETGGREELHAARGGALSAHLRTRRGR